MLKQLFLTRLRRFVNDTRGSSSIGVILMAPLLFWAFMAAFVFFDGYRQSAVNLKAAYTISDLISRETDAITDNYIDSMHNLLDMLTNTTSATTLRITVIHWDQGDERYYVDWSANRGFAIDLDNDNIQDLKEKLPTMPDNERVILVETTNRFVPMFNVGVPATSLDNFVFTRPRFAPQVVWSDA